MKRAPSFLKAIGGGLFVAFAGILLWYWVLRPFPTAELKAAFETKEYGRVQEAWRRGGRLPDGDPHVELMRARDRLERKGAKAANIEVRKVSPSQRGERYLANLELEDKSAKFTVVVEWNAQRWSLLTKNALMPAYVFETFK